VTVSGNTIRDSLYNSVDFSTSTAITFENNTVDTPGLNGIVIGPAFFPAPTGSATLTNNVVTGVPAAKSAFINMSTGFTVMQSGNNW
jgi:hypothetical protein